MKSRHDGDCYWWSVRICTCGWFHELAGRATGDTPDLVEHEENLDKLIIQRQETKP